jgi:hypothetical protein
MGMDIYHYVGPYVACEVDDGSEEGLPCNFVISEEIKEQLFQAEEHNNFAYDIPDREFPKHNVNKKLERKRNLG